MHYEEIINAVMAAEGWSREDARKLVDDALEAGMTEQQIIEGLFGGGTDTIIVNTWTRRTFPKGVYLSR